MKHLSQEELTRKDIGEIDTDTMSYQKIIEEVIRRLLYICDKERVNITKKELSIILGKADRYLAHVFSENYKYNPSLEIIIQFTCLLHIPTCSLFCSRGKNFKKYYSDTEKIKTLKQCLTLELEKIIKRPMYIEDYEKLERRISCLKTIKERLEKEIEKMK